MSSSADSNNVYFAEFGFPQVCRTCSVRSHGICGALRSPELFELSKFTSQRTVQKGQTISYDGDEATEYVNIVSGIVKLTKTLADGRHQILALQFAPEFVGRPFATVTNASAEAATDLEICALPKEAVEKMLDTQPDFERRMFMQTVKQLDTSREWMLALGRKNAHERVAGLLSLILAHEGKPVDGRPGAVQFELGLTRTEIADFLGLTIETVSRQMTRMRKEGLIEIEKHHKIVALHVDRLRAACEEESGGA